MGNSDYRPVCDRTQSENTGVLCLDSPDNSIGTGLPLNLVGEHVCICIPSDKSDSEGLETHAEISMRGNSDCPTLAQTALVSNATSVTNSPAIEITGDTRVTESGKDKDISRKRPKSQTDCMASIDKQFKTKGFSKNTRKLLAASWRSGTQKDYKCKFRKFYSWCREREIDPYLASLDICANFLTSLFDKGLKYRTIAGYRSMLSSVLPPIDNVRVGQHPYIIRLLKGVFNSRPPVRKLLPEWDLPSVLDMLKQPPFEPMQTARLKYITWKTIFLIAITTFRRSSDLQALRLGEGSVRVQKTGVTFIRHGLSKQDRISHNDSNIFVPTFTGTKFLDPKRALALYLRRTEKFRNALERDGDKLFLSVNKPHKPVSSQTISSWIVRTIKLAYKYKNEDIDNVRGHSTRSIGPSWALFKGVPMNQIMDSADWSQPSTFIKFYLKTVNVDFLDV